MKIKFFLLITFCLIGLCISEEINPEIPVERNEQTEDEDGEELEKTEQDTLFSVNEQTQEQVNLDSQELIQLFQREKSNGGQCFLDVIETIQELQIDYNQFQYELSCYKHLCQITSKIPSSEEWNQCRFQYCDYNYIGDSFQINLFVRSIKECLIDYEQEQTQNNNNSNNNNNNNNNNNKTSQQNPSQKIDEITKSTSKKEIDNQNNENDKNIGNDNKTFSCILSFLLIGFNIILF